MEENSPHRFSGDTKHHFRDMLAGPFVMDNGKPPPVSQPTSLASQQQVQSYKDARQQQQQQQHNFVREADLRRELNLLGPHGAFKDQQQLLRDEQQMRQHHHHHQQQQQQQQHLDLVNAVELSRGDKQRQAALSVAPGNTPGRAGSAPQSNAGDHDGNGEPSTTGAGGNPNGGTSTPNFTVVKPQPAPTPEMPDYFMYAGDASKLNMEAFYGGRAGGPPGINLGDGTRLIQLGRDSKLESLTGLYDPEVFKAAAAAAGTSGGGLGGASSSMNLPQVSTPQLQPQETNDPSLEGRIHRCDMCSKVFSNAFFLQQHR